MSFKRPYVLTIAGFDPSNGAGLTADVKTVEKHRCYGLSVCTAITIQNDIELQKCLWTKLEVIKSQINLLFDRFKINHVKIGIIENWIVLNSVIDLLLEKNPSVKIILDPILTSSSNYDFHSDDAREFDEILNKIYLLTPNYDEIFALYSDRDLEDTIAHIKSKTNLFLKGGHRSEKKGRDELFTNTGKHFIFNPQAKNISKKHGSGCVLSSSITSYLALDFPIVKACYKGKKYTERFLNSNKSLLGFHL